MNRFMYVLVLLSRAVNQIRELIIDLTVPKKHFMLFRSFPVYAYIASGVLKLMKHLGTIGPLS